MPHDLRIIRPPKLGTQVTEPTLPLLHPHFRHDFQWGEHSAGIHAQRLRAGDLRAHPDWLYLRLPDGSYHEVQYSRLVRLLEHPPVVCSTPCIAHAFSRESDPTLEKLREIAKACGLS